MKREIVIVGAGHAGVQAAASLRDEGFDGTIRLIDAGRELPYQRPPLSKAWLKGEAGVEDLLLRPGMTATATIVTERRADQLLVPNAALRFVPPIEQRFGGPRRITPTGPTVWVLR
jgi:3-phenylpropionate/trans-cinnamate dioxygenase ferredoxin reductase subunit